MKIAQVPLKKRGPSASPHRTARTGPQAPRLRQCTRPNASRSTPILRGANPAVQLLDGEQTVALASIWRVDESPMGSGTALILWHAGRVRIIGVDPGLGSWLSGRFVRHFPEAEEVWSR